MLNETDLKDEEGDRIGVRDWCAWGRKDDKWIPFESETLDQNINCEKLRGNALAFIF